MRKMSLVIDRHLIQGDVSGNVMSRPTWYLDLDCGHTKSVGKNSPQFGRAETTNKVICPFCFPTDKKAKSVGVDQEYRFAAYFRE